jgi:hypothetical protein
MYNDLDRPPWLRNLRPPRPEPEPEAYPSGRPSAESATQLRRTEAIEEVEEEVHKPMSRQQMLLLAILLWANVSILGCLCLLATQVVQP